MITAKVTFSINNGYAKEIPLEEFMKNFGDKLEYSKIEGNHDDDYNRELKELEGD